jgi:aspartyl protease family protein
MFTVTRIIDGNTMELSNGIVVSLSGVQKNEDNVKILERYLKGSILLYDNNDEEITSFSQDHISAKVFNADGDCVNLLLARITEITKDESPEIVSDSPASNKTVVRWESTDGVLNIPVEINGVQMYFIFDTGAGLISISQAVADDLYRKGKLLNDDFIGKGQFSDANGDITEGTIINLSSVIIGDRELKNVQACVTQGQNAPLLFGQSALQKFGKVSIDYNTKEITFE